MTYSAGPHRGRGRWPGVAKLGLVGTSRLARKLDYVTTDYVTQI